MTKGLFEYILKYSKSEQILLVLVTLLSLPFYYFSLDLPKLIVNNAIDGERFPADLTLGLGDFSLGYFDQIPYLVILCFIFLGLVFINGGFKYFINTYSGVLGERMLRRLRYQLLDRMLRFPIGHFRHVSQGQLVSMVNQETEPLAGFVGESISVPMYQGGIMITILIFMFVQDWVLGLAAIALYPFQSWLIPKLQHRVNLLNRERVKRLRALADMVGESVAGVQDIHSNDSSAFAKSLFSDSLGRIFDIRVQIFRKKFFIKFLNNFIAQLTPFFFFLIGGYLVINDRLSFGALVAVLAAYKDISAPWKNLLGWYQRLADTRMRYEVLVDQFSPDGMLDQALQAPATTTPTNDSSTFAIERSPLSVQSVSWSDAEGGNDISNITLAVHPGDRIAIIGGGSSGKDILANIITRLLSPAKGRLTIAGQDAATLSETMINRSVGYLGPNSYIFSGSVRQNLLMGVKNSPQLSDKKVHVSSSSRSSPDWKARAVESRRAGNSDLNPRGYWIDFSTISLDSTEDLPGAILSILKTVDLADELFQFALKRPLDEARYPHLKDKLLLARQHFRRRLNYANLESVVEPLNYDEFNRNTTVAENLLFGTATAEPFNADNLWSDPSVAEVLNELDLQAAFDKASIDIAEVLVELLMDLPPEHEFSERFNFVEPDQIPVLANIVSRLESTDVYLDDLSASDQQLIRALPFKTIPGRHRLGIFDEELQTKIVLARHLLLKRMPQKARREIDVFAEHLYNSATSIEDNIIFGRIAYGRLGAADHARSVILEVFDELDLLPDLLDIALRSPVGVGGSRLTQATRQKVALARALIKEPSTLVVNEGLSALDSETVDRVLDNTIAKYPSMAIVWMDNQLRFSDRFDRVMYLEQGKITRIQNLSEERAEEAGEATTSTNAPDESDAFRSATSLKDSEKMAMVRSIPMFRHLDPPSLKLIANACDAVDFKAGEVLCRQGDTGDALYVLVSGSVAVIINTENSQQQIGVRHSPDVIGEIALLTQARRTATIEAATDIATLRLSKEVFVDTLHSNGEIGYQILQILAARFADNSSNLGRSLGREANHKADAKD